MTSYPKTEFSPSSKELDTLQGEIEFQAYGNDGTRQKLAGYHKYFRRERDQWLDVHPATTPEVMYYTEKGEYPLEGYTPFVRRPERLLNEHGDELPLFRAQNQQMWAPLIFQGGAKEFHRDQIMAFGWHLRRPEFWHPDVDEQGTKGRRVMRPTFAPQLEGVERDEVKCMDPSCSRYFGSQEDMLAHAAILHRDATRDAALASALMASGSAGDARTTDILEALKDLLVLQAGGAPVETVAKPKASTVPDVPEAVETVHNPELASEPDPVTTGAVEDDPALKPRPHPERKKDKDGRFIKDKERKS